MQSTSVNNNRIVSIDVLRALTLLGILIVHTASHFGFDSSVTEPSVTDTYISKFTSLFLSEKCAKIFSILFGVSFFIISNKKSYSPKKFIARCIILIVFGIFNKLFYTFDALIWYGICGLSLIPLRNWSIPKLIGLFTVLFMIQFPIKFMQLGDLLLPNASNTRYNSDNTLLDIILQQPDSIVYYIKLVLNRGIVGTHCYFILGYIIAKKGLYQLADIRLRTVLIAVFANVITHAIILFFPKDAAITIITRSYIIPLSLSLLYFALFFYVYKLLSKVNATKCIDYLSYYGKMGLTNYSLQGIVGVCYFYFFSTSLTTSIVVMILFHVLQSIFSYFYLKYHKQGPLEWLWRKLIDSTTK